MRTCDQFSFIGGETVRCTLPVGHGGVHAHRTEKSRGEATTVGTSVLPDYPTSVFETVCTWRDGQPATPHAVQR